MSLRGLVLTFTARREAQSLMGLTGWTVDGDQKFPLNFFILCGYIDYVSVFFSRELRKSAREQFSKSVREHFASARERLKKNCPWTPKVPVNSQKSARET